jgi:hypothetical protein
MGRLPVRGLTFVQSNTQVDFTSSERRDSRFDVYIGAFKLVESILSTHGRFGEGCSMALNSTGRQPSTSEGSCWFVEVA